MSRLLIFTSFASIALFAGGVSGLLFDDAAPAYTGSAGPTVLQSERPASKLPEPSPLESKPHRTVMIEAGQNLTEVLIAAGIGGLDAALADRALLDTPLTPGRPIKLWLGSSLPNGARLLERMEVRGTGNRVVTLVRRDDSFAVHAQQVEVNDTPVRIRVPGPELAAELVKSRVPAATRTQVLARLGSAAPATVELIIAHEESAGERSFGPLLYLAVTERSGELRRWLGDGNGNLRPVGTARSDDLQRPVAGPVTSDVGLRFHPVLRFLRWHRGTDFAAPPGAPVQAALAGRVLEAGWSGGYGRMVRLLHGDGSITAYAHLSRIEVEPGEQVTRGAIIGSVGSTGLATGPHLHFEWLRNGDALKPTFGAAAGSTSFATDHSTRSTLRALLASAYRTPS